MKTFVISHSPLFLLTPVAVDFAVDFQKNKFKFHMPIVPSKVYTIQSTHQEKAIEEEGVCLSG
jgi:hypothetical protein